MFLLGDFVLGEDSRIAQGRKPRSSAAMLVIGPVAVLATGDIGSRLTAPTRSRLLPLPAQAIARPAMPAKAIWLNTLPAPPPETSTVAYPRAGLVAGNATAREQISGAAVVQVGVTDGPAIEIASPRPAGTADPPRSVMGADGTGAVPGNDSIPAHPLTMSSVWTPI
ncbi:hypothetical protein [Mycobacterium gastri]|uniref:Uncharacterized protein n=1 Tax=Mycobacterium gastri TaxID=1777 RepID=A0A1X1VYR6_MYCGS|nr:hypothetical protein MGAST_06915 [Mycobacterium gastri 'Wayne']ORV75470.1 hypothetical protein AWC07_23360 [Mycobacterium gastri]